MFRDVYKRANEKIHINPEVIDAAEGKISQQIKGISKKNRKFNVSKIAVIPIFVMIIISLVVGIPRILNNPTEINAPHSVIRKGSPYMEFDYQIEIKADSNPLHPNQEFTIQADKKKWEGKNTRIYYLEASETNTNELMYKHVLPSDSKLIGTVEIVEGKWSYKWKVPDNINKKGYGCFFIAAVSDKGIISGVRVETLPYKSFDILPKEASIGQEIKYSISGFPKGYTMEVYLIQVKPGISPGETIATLGTFKNTNGSLNSSFKLSESINGNIITPGQYILQATIIPKDERKEIRQAVFGYFNVK